ncbi:MAG: hypothetical protein WBA61_15765 [Aequorivita sp.]
MAPTKKSFENKISANPKIKKNIDNRLSNSLDDFETRNHLK